MHPVYEHVVFRRFPFVVLLRSELPVIAVHEGIDMKYLFLLYDNLAAGPAQDSPEAQAAFAAYGAFYEETNAAGAFQAGDPINPGAGSTVRVRGGNATTSSGPFVTGAEQLVGFYVLECANDDAAAAYAAKIPAASTGTVEVRPILAM
jgi:hypothetical protein